MATLNRPAAGVDAELLVIDADEPDQLRHQAEALAGRVGRLSHTELGGLAVQLTRQSADRRYRAAAVAGSPEQAGRQLHRLAELLRQPPGLVWEPDRGIFAGRVDGRPRIGFLFPGQGSGSRSGGGALRRRFKAILTGTRLPDGGDVAAAALPQPWVTASSLAGLRVLSELGIEASTAVGDGAGELTALHWAGSLDAPTLLRLVELRDRVLIEHSVPGRMVSVAAGPDRVEPLLTGTGAVVAGYHGPTRTVVAGSEPAVRHACARSTEAGLSWTPVPVSRAFHSPLMARSAAVFAEHLAGERFAPLTRPVISTVTGAQLTAGTDPAALLTRQITTPVRFAAALTTAAADTDLLIEVGAGAVLSGLAADTVEAPTLPVDTDSGSLTSLWGVVAAAFVAGVLVRFDRLPAPVAAG